MQRIISLHARSGRTARALLDGVDADVRHLTWQTLQAAVPGPADGVIWAQQPAQHLQDMTLVGAVSGAIATAIHRQDLTLADRLARLLIEVTEGQRTAAHPTHRKALRTAMLVARTQGDDPVRRAAHHGPRGATPRRPSGPGARNQRPAASAGDGPVTASVALLYPSTEQSEAVNG